MLIGASNSNQSVDWHKIKLTGFYKETTDWLKIKFTRAHFESIHFIQQIFSFLM